MKRRSCCAAAWLSSCRRRFSSRKRRTSSSRESLRRVSLATLSSSVDKWDCKSDTEFLKHRKSGGWLEQVCRVVDWRGKKKRKRIWRKNAWRLIYIVYRVARTRLNVASLNLRDGIASIDKSVVGPLLGVLLWSRIHVVILPTIHVRIVMIFRVFDGRQVGRCFGNRMGRFGNTRWQSKLRDYRHTHT